MEGGRGGEDDGPTRFFMHCRYLNDTQGNSGRNQFLIHTSVTFLVRGGGTEINFNSG